MTVALDLKASQKHLWHRKRARRTTDAKPIPRTHVAFRPPVVELPKMSGGLWEKKSEKVKPGLWQRPVRSKTVAPDSIPAKVPLWSKGTARRNTLLKPTRSDSQPAKPMSRKPLPSFNPSTDQLWSKENAVPRVDPQKKLWDKEEPHTADAPRLWSQAPERITTIPKPERIPDIVQDLPDPEATGTPLWSRAPSPVPAAHTLWQPPSNTPSSSSSPRPESPESSPSPEPKTPSPNENLWSPSAKPVRRGTDKKPSRAGPGEKVGRKKSDPKVEKATGGLWGSPPSGGWEKAGKEVPEVEENPGLTRVSTVESFVDESGGSAEEDEEGGKKGWLWRKAGGKVEEGKKGGEVKVVGESEKAW